MKITLKRSLMAVLCVVGMSSFVACSDSDGKGEPFTPISENGSYAGTMTFVADSSDKVSEPEAVEFKTVQYAAIDSLEFDKFPVSGVVKSILGDAGAEAILPMIGDVKYKIEYNTVINAENTEATLTFKANTLSIPLAAVLIEIEPVGTGKYNSVTKKMTFSLKAKSVTVGGNPFEFTPLTFTFEATRK